MSEETETPKQPDPHSPEEKERIIRESLEALAKENLYTFTDPENNESITVKESELNKEQIELLTNHLFKTYNESPQACKNAFFAYFVAKQKQFMEANKHVGKRKYGYKNKS